MSLGSFFQMICGQPRFADYPKRKFTGNARKMGVILIELWKTYRTNNPNFDPFSSQPERASRECPDALRWICLRLGYEESWSNTFCQHAYLGDMALNLLRMDLLQGNRNIKKDSKAVMELHQCFCELLPDQVGGLEAEARMCQS